MKTHLILEAKRQRWLNQHVWWVRVIEPKFYVYGLSHKRLDKGVALLLKRVRMYGQLPKYSRISYEFLACPGDGCGGCGSCWAGEGALRPRNNCLIAPEPVGMDMALEVLGIDKAAHEARVAELIDRNKGFLTPP